MPLSTYILEKYANPILKEQTIKFGQDNVLKKKKKKQISSK